MTRDYRKSKVYSYVRWQVNLAPLSNCAAWKPIRRLTLESPSVFRSNSRQEFLAHDPSVFYGVNADLGHFSPFLRLFVRHLGVVLHDEAIVADKRVAGIEAMDVHRVHPPVDFAAHAFFAACLGRLAHTVGFHALDVIIVKRV